MRVKTIDRSVLKALRADMQEALEQVNRKYGIKLDVGNASYDVSGRNGKFTVKVSTVESDGTVVDEYLSAYRSSCELYRLKPEWLGAEFAQGGDRFKVSGLNTGAKRGPNGMPVLAVSARNGKTYKFTAEAVRRAMGEPPTKPLFASVPVLNPDPTACTCSPYDFSARVAKPCPNRATTLRDGERVCAGCAASIDEARRENAAEARCS